MNPRKPQEAQNEPQETPRAKMSPRRPQEAQNESHLTSLSKRQKNIHEIVISASPIQFSSAVRINLKSGQVWSGQVWSGLAWGPGGVAGGF